MAIAYIGNGIYLGLAADNKATITNPITNALFIETDSGKISRYNGSAWVVGTVAVYNDQANTFTTSQTFNATTTQKLRSADGASFYYNINPGTIAADRNFVLPNMTSNDVAMVTAHAQTVTSKTMVLASNTITDTSAATGDTVRYNGTRFVRLAMGTANQVLATNSGATDIAYTTLNKDHIMHVNNPIKIARKFGALYGTSVSPLYPLNLTISAATGQASATPAILTSIGRYVPHTTGAVSGDNAGGHHANLLQRSHNPYWSFRGRMSSATVSTYRTFFGLSSDAANSPTGDTYADSKSVAMIGHRTTDTNWQFIHNDGSATALYENTGVAVNSSLRTFEIYGDDSGARFGYSIDGAAVTWFTSQVPATGTNLGIIHEIETAEAVAKSFDLIAMYVEFDSK
jgi:hypothetical protein